VPVLCVVRTNRVESRYGDVVVVSLDRLLAGLERAALRARRSEQRQLAPLRRKRTVRCIEPLGLNPVRARVPDRNDG
jgi:hypothetical protein